MALSDHFREFRARLLRVALLALAVFVVALFLFDPLYDLVYGPYQTAQEKLGEDSTIATTSGPGGGLLLYLKLCGFAALVATGPYWLYQIWAFVLPGLHPNEKKYTRMFAGIAGPLFIGGVALGYYVLPKGLSVLISFTPNGVTNLIDFTKYFSFLMRMLLVFGIAMEIPLFVVLLNLAGVVSGQQIGRARPWIVIGTMVFAAVATPSTDPFSMLMLGIPMLILFGLSEIIARILDRIRGKGAHSPSRTDQWADDEASPL
jgi:sec-independent protein translocase protein TatC